MFCLSLASALLLPPAARATESLTLEQALQLFEKQGFDLLLADVAVQSAQGDVAMAGASTNPTLNGSVGGSFGYDPRICPGCSAVAWSVGVGDSAAISDLLSGKRGLRIDVANAALQASRHSREDAKRSLSSVVKQQFLQALTAKASLATAQELQHSAEETARVVEIRFKAGAVNAADLARARTAALEAAQVTDSAALALRQARTTLAFLIGSRVATVDVEPVGDWLQTTSPNMVAASSDTLLANAREHRPDLLAAQQQLKRAELSVSLNRRQVFPDIALNAQYAMEGSGQNAIQPPTVTVGLSAPIPILYRAQGEIQKAEADLRAQQIAAAKTEAQVATDVLSSFAAYQTAAGRLTRMQGGLLEEAQKARDLTRVQYEKGAASLLELLDAQRQFAGIATERLQILTELWTAVFQLEAAVGMELRS
jgi:cobalt-zinc-cadmium efflux system outer membrane protein